MIVSFQMVQVQDYEPLEISVGDTVTFEWSGFHGIVEVPSGECPTNFMGPDIVTLADESAGGSFTWEAAEPGTYWLACQVGTHCLGGQIIQITVV